MTRRARRAVLTLTLTPASISALVFGIVHSTASAETADEPNPHHVVGTDHEGLWLHTVPAVHDGFIRVLPEGAEFSVICWTLGDDVSGNQVWLLGTSDGDTGYVTDVFIDTEWQTTDDLTAQGIPNCDSAVEVTPPTEQPANEVILNMGPDPGVRERNLAELVPEIEYAARAAGVEAQTLARIIYHEGGAYLNGTRSSAELLDRSGIHESVGIAQVKVSTARQIDREVYGDDMMASWSDEAVRNRLIYDIPYALRTAAGKLSRLRDQGVEGRYGLFMTYNLRLDSAYAWVQNNYTLDGATLAALDINQDVQLRRQQELNEAVAALEQG